MPWVCPPLVRSLRAVRFAVGVLAVAWTALATGATADVRPVVGPGATRDEALAAYGWPTGQSQSGTREILTYPQGRIFLENGRIERVDFSPTTAWPAPRPKPAGPTTTAGKKAEPAVEHWTTDFAAAQAEARTRHARVLAVFTGSDWSPGSRQFDDEVAADPEFVATFAADYVFLKVDFPNRKTLPEALRAQNTLLRERYGVTTYPTMLVLSPAGTLLAKVDLENLLPGDSYRTRIASALRIVRDALTAKPPAPDPVPAATAPESAPPTGPAPAPMDARTELGASLSSATWLLTTSLAGGSVLVGLLLCRLWRDRAASAGDRAPVAKAAAEAPATAMPALSASGEWSRDQLCLVTGRLIEAEGLRASIRPAGGDIDVAASRAGEVRVRALVLCVPAEHGPVTAKRIRELFATVTLEGAAEGWVVAPGGFTAEAKAFAAEKEITTIDATGLTERLAALPPLARSRLLGAAG